MAILYNVYTNDQTIPIQPGAKSFIYADDVALAIQGNNFEEIKSKMNIALRSMLAFITRRITSNLTQIKPSYVPSIYAIDKHTRNLRSHGKEKNLSTLVSQNT